MTPTIAEVESLSNMGWQGLDDTLKQDLLDISEREADTIYSGQTSTLSILEGNRDDFIKYLAAHKWEQAEGGEAQSENAGGGSVTYNTVTGEIPKGLSETRYGRTALEYIRDEMSISVVRTY